MSQFWKIEESVGRYYIVWDGIYDTKEEAEKVISLRAPDSNCRAVLYRRGHSSHGPERVT